MHHARLGDRPLEGAGMAERLTRSSHSRRPATPTKPARYPDSRSARRHVCRHRTRSLDCSASASARCELGRRGRAICLVGPRAVGSDRQSSQVADGVCRMSPSPTRRLKGFLDCPRPWQDRRTLQTPMAHASTLALARLRVTRVPMGGHGGSRTSGGSRLAGWHSRRQAGRGDGR